MTCQITGVQVFQHLGIGLEVGVVREERHLVVLLERSADLFERYAQFLGHQQGDRDLVCRRPVIEIFKLLEGDLAFLDQIVEGAQRGLEIETEFLADQFGDLIGMALVILGKDATAVLVDHLKYAEQGVLELDRHNDHRLGEEPAGFVETVIKGQLRVNHFK